MITEKLRQLVEKTFARDPEFGKDVILALKLERNLSFLGKDRKREQWEIAALSKIQQAHETGVIPDEV
jgi:hypothetical protein